MTTITKQQARQFILAKQGLIGAYRFAGKDGAYEYVRQAGCIQYDPVDVCGKNAELTLQSRVKGFRKPMLQELLYKDRKLVDYPDKELSIWPAEDWPYFSSYRERSRDLGETFAGLEGLQEQARAYIAEHGPVCSDTLPIEGEIFWHSSMHWSGNWDRPSPAARSVLEQLYTDGELVIHHKQGSRKYYDLAAKHLPADVLASANPCADEESFQTWRVLRRIGAEEGDITGSLFRQTGIFFLLPLLLACIHSVFGMKFAIGLMEEFGTENLFQSIAVTSSILFLIYGGYFLVTYFSGRGIIRDNRSNTCCGSGHEKPGPAFPPRHPFCRPSTPPMSADLYVVLHEKRRKKELFPC